MKLTIARVLGSLFPLNVMLGSRCIAECKDHPDVWAAIEIINECVLPITAHEGEPPLWYEERVIAAVRSHLVMLTARRVGR